MLMEHESSCQNADFSSELFFFKPQLQKRVPPAEKMKWRGRNYANNDSTADLTAS